MCKNLYDLVPILAVIVLVGWMWWVLFNAGE